jgi:hypothetical protein
LPSNLLSGHLPDGLFSAQPMLETLRLQKNQLSGPVSDMLSPVRKLATNRVLDWDEERAVWK